MKGISSVYNSHLGKTAFILGAGPSLIDLDTNLIKNHVTITVNSAILKMADCDYWLTDDQDVESWDYFTREVRNSKSTKLLDFRRCNKISKKLIGEVVLYKHQDWLDWYDRRRKKHDLSKAIFTRDISKPLVGTRTSVGTAVHVAWLMGCSKICLLGCDCGWRKDRRYFWQLDEWKGRVPSRSYPDPTTNTPQRILGTKNYTDFHCKEMIWFWDAFSLLLKKNNINVLNLTPDSRIKSLPIGNLGNVVKG
jgi:hypothetical protein